MSFNTFLQLRWKGHDNMTSHTCSTVSGVQTERGRRRGLLSFTDPS